MTMSKESKSMHIVMYPWLALSHITSFLRLSNKLAERGLKISFFLPINTIPKLSPQNHHPNLITFFPITLPLVDGLPSGAETTNDVPISSQSLIATAMDLTQDMMDSHLANLKPDYVLFDVAHWMPELARKHGIKSLYYATSSLVRYAYFKSMTPSHLVQPDAAARKFPCPSMRLRAGEIKYLVQISQQEYGKGVQLVERANTSLRECDAIGSKTCREMEGPYVDYLEKIMGKPVLLAGPMVPDPPKSKLEARFDNWLNGFSKASVVYCALGSECVLSKELFLELVLGLELTGLPFLVALKPPLGCETIESALPQGFLERTQERGIVHGGWVQQLLILEHPSVGCFITHCGAGSLSEAILSECQLVLLPQAVDQFINARFMSIDLRIGIEVDKREDDNFFAKEDVCKAIKMVMELESEVGKEVKNNHAKIKQALLKEGLEASYIDSFIKSLQALLA